MRQEPQCKNEQKTPVNSCLTDRHLSSLEKRESEIHHLIDFLYSKCRSKKLETFIQETQSTLEREATDILLKRLIADINFDEANQKLEMKSKIGSVQNFLKDFDELGDKINSIFSRSNLTYFEHKDPYFESHQRFMFCLNIRDANLASFLGESYSNVDSSIRSTFGKIIWDSVIAKVSELIFQSGLKPNYIKNDENHFAFSMRQYVLAAEDDLKSDYFSLEIHHHDENSRKELVSKYLNKSQEYDLKTVKFRKKIKGWLISCSQKERLKAQLCQIEKERTFFSVSQVDPQELENGIVLIMKLSGLQCSLVKKDKVRALLFKFLIDLSRILSN